MDANKLEQLIDVGYVIRRVCGNCAHGIGLHSEWGLCREHSYVHLKHIDNPRLLSVYSTGYCANHEFVEPLALGAYEEFKEE